MTTTTGTDERTPNEKLYDDVIAPKLLEVSRLCKDAGMPMLATVWFDGESSGTTRTLPSEPHPPFTLAHAANRCGGNIDRLCMALAREVPDGAEQSVVLMLLKQANL